MLVRTRTGIYFTVCCILIAVNFVYNQEISYCPPHLADEPSPSASLVFVSTLDGHVTALNTADGSEQWSVQVGDDLLSNNIEGLELTSSGHLSKLIPSLGGSLYRFTGDHLEVLPWNAEQLLSSSYKYSEDVIIAGGKETATVGLSSKTGKLMYECSISGCINNTVHTSGGITGNIEEPGELIVVRRITQTVRALDPRSGLEKWNFSVGQHELMLKPIEGCHLENTENNNVSSDIAYKVVVSEGLICAVKKKSPKQILWKHKLSTPIVNAWNSDGENLKSIDMFGAAELPNIENIVRDAKTSRPNSITPSVYIAMHNRQLYIQESVQMQALVDSQTSHRPPTGLIIDSRPNVVVPWKPLPARIPPIWHLTDDTDTALVKIDDKKYEMTSGLSVLYGSEYMNGLGYYLYGGKQVDGSTCNKKHGIPTKWIKGLDYEDKKSPWFYLKMIIEYARKSPAEVMFALVVGILVYHFSGIRQLIRNNRILVEQMQLQMADPYNAHRLSFHHANNHSILPVTNISRGDFSSSQLSESSSSSNSPFTSRYLTDFTPIKCLGRGGFGIVFEAKNKIDDCSYAVKRITLPNRRKKRDKVLREVRALAKLDHKNIVRYFNAWLEEPPIGWEDPLEKEFKTQLDFTDTYSKVGTTNAKSSSIVQDNGNSILELSHNSPSFDKHKQKIRNNDSRPRSYSFNDSISIVFEKDAEEKESSSYDESDTKESTGPTKDTKKSPESKDDDDSFIIFCNPDEMIDSVKHNKSESIISISDSVFETDTTDKSSAVKNNTNCAKVTHVNELPAVSKVKKHHRRNLSLDLPSSSCEPSPSHSIVTVGKVYLYIQMQLCKEESLKDWLQHNVDPEIRKQEVISIFEQIVNAVEYVHLQGLIHRDLKPSNIFFSTDGRIKIGDFGLVTTMTDPLTGAINGDQARSPILGAVNEGGSERHTQLVGTHLYMSPEQLRSEPHGYKVDIWSLGLVLAELLIPFGTEMERIVSLRAIRELHFPAGFKEKYPQEHSLLCLMLSPESTKRPSTLGVRARAPLLHHTDPKYHFSLPPRTPHSSTSSN